MEFRRLLKEDLESCFANRLRALRLAPHAFLTTYEEEKERGNSHFAATLAHAGADRAIFGAVSEGVVVGTVGIMREDRPKTRHKARIWGMFVDADQRQSGIGGTILDLAIRHAREEMKVAAIFLAVEADNRSAKRLCESRGFKCWGTEPFAMFAEGRYFSEDHMVLEL